MPTSVINEDDEFGAISTHRPLAAASVHSKKSPSISTASSTHSEKSPSISSSSTLKVLSKWSRKSANKDERDDNSSLVSKSVTSGKREEEVHISLPASMANPGSVSREHSEAPHKISQSLPKATAIPRDLDVSSRASSSARSRKSTSSSSSSAKSTKCISVPASIGQDNLDQLRAMVLAAGSEVNQEAPSVTSSMAAKRRQLKAKEIEIEQKRMALEEAARRNMQREKEINEMVLKLRRKDVEEVAAKMQMLKILELQLKEQKRELKIKERKSGREINSKFEVIRMSEDERLMRETEIEHRLIDLARKEQEINERQAAIDEASVARKKKEEKLEVQVIVFARKEKEIKDRLAAIEAASAARRKKEKSASIARGKKKIEESVKQQNEINSKPINNSQPNKKGGKTGKRKSIFRKKKPHEA